MKKNITEQSCYQLVFCTCPDEDVAINIAENIVAQKLAACVNVLPAVYSVYHWQDNVESAKENMILIKTTKEKYVSLEQVITSLHPYEVPEIIAIDITSGLPDYLKWIDSSIN
ncbi:MAG: divalent-cation tolerance protein CutA [gamma proteobacterium symbiont of Bathyaustriella thionipta]|nr:divalent-cation tolerance protein CutA [gamma proteobacterium symbiont of Bathyaustriella thionipta]MCU7948754.1 divalent-cation tolerance protein CutA [gamma proteobacterium symbiont of Bathyaustriella thionipta]MCU7953550.1 divalent-cation tolerance protein CutA [gamma proteobacterium symbiont of Bathyaustriella thionipta]MCU7955237.1 divalent-cation tolerance protein CutA [gamma proteobacterium symbiont of Bathyaustriella thionipta]MCU7967027.1 divalent-cation tolerance protein CutA [gamm